MNLLPAGAAYGLVVLVFQQGHGASVLVFERVEVIEIWLSLMLSSILLGLSMDSPIELEIRLPARPWTSRRGSSERE